MVTCYAKTSPVRSSDAPILYQLFSYLTKAITGPAKTWNESQTSPKTPRPLKSIETRGFCATGAFGEAQVKHSIPWPKKTNSQENSTTTCYRWHVANPTPAGQKRFWNTEPSFIRRHRPKTSAWCTAAPFALVSSRAFCALFLVHLGSKNPPCAESAVDQGPPSVMPGQCLAGWLPIAHVFRHP